MNLSGRGVDRWIGLDWIVLQVAGVGGGVGGRNHMNPVNWVAREVRNAENTR